MIPFMSEAQNRQVPIDRSISLVPRICDRGGQEKWGMSAHFFICWWRFSKFRCLWSLHSSAHILKVFELYTLKQWNLWYINYGSYITNLFFKNYKKNTSEQCANKYKVLLSPIDQLSVCILKIHECFDL